MNNPPNNTDPPGPSNTERGSPPGSPGFLRRALRGLRLAVRLGLGAGLLGVLSLAAAFWYLSHDLPSFESLESYHPPQMTRVFSSEGIEIGSFFKERRTVVPLAAIPTVLKHAIIAAEDEHFYAHEGIDYLGILRAALKNLLAGRVKQGASTITQQVVKTFLLSPEKKLKRKMREMILARRLEKNLSKDEILALYLNQIYLGHGRYGVEEAAQFYFGHSVREVTLSEAAILAGLPKSPAYYSPRRFPKKAKERRAYVLGRMAAVGFISAAEADKAAQEPLQVAPLPPPSIGASYLEEVRRRLVALGDRVGEKRLLEGGLRVTLGMNARLQAAAEDALRDGLHRVDRRQGWQGALAHLRPSDADNLKARFEHELQRRKKRGQRMMPWIWDLSRLKKYEPDQESAPPLDLVLPVPGALVAGLVTQVSPPDRATVSLGSGDVQIFLKDLKWARPRNISHKTPPPSSIAQLVKVQDVVTLRLDKRTSTPDPPDSPEAAQRIHATLSQRPRVQGALVSIDPRSRAVLALVGGYDATKDAFDRATQARRQPGSSFKPYVYGAAIDTGLFTAASRVLDAPEVFRDPWTGKVWKPQNYSHRFDGELSLRQALARSKNIVAVRLIAKVGVDTVVDFAKRAGIQSKLPRVMPLALGAGEVTPLEHINGLATLAAMGVRAEPRLILAVQDSTGALLYGDPEEGEETIRPAVSYVIADLMRSVMTEGTGRHLNELGRKISAKTGTTSDQKDAWFVGFSPQIVCGVWVGFDNPKPMGRREFGSTAAGPIWLGTMKEALRDVPPDWFDPPEGVVFVRINPNNGLLARPEGPGVYEPFVSGTEPLELSPEEGSLSPADFLTLDPREDL